MYVVALLPSWPWFSVRFVSTHEEGGQPVARQTRVSRRKKPRKKVRKQSWNSGTKWNPKKQEIRQGSDFSEHPFTPSSSLIAGHHLEASHYHTCDQDEKQRLGTKVLGTKTFFATKFRGTASEGYAALNYCEKAQKENLRNRTFFFQEISASFLGIPQRQLAARPDTASRLLMSGIVGALLW